ncbi:hypothetical protein ACFQL1_20400 [Halomicroarcula sp. GCM10025709]|uniref:hypothetical protein n=1 Tax=Halomicroarcula sp. GCM10025709 TaxID=3252669 RepID=UPI003616B0AF
MIRRFALLLIVACSIALVPAVGAQETTTTSTPTANGTANVTAPAQAPAAELVVDDDLVVTDYRYQDGEMVITFWSSQYKAVNIAPAAGHSSAGTVSFRAAVVDADRKTTVRVASPAASRSGPSNPSRTSGSTTSASRVRSSSPVPGVAPTFAMPDSAVRSVSPSPVCTTPSRRRSALPNEVSVSHDRGRPAGRHRP